MNILLSIVATFPTIKLFYAFLDKRRVSFSLPKTLKRLSTNSDASALRLSLKLYTDHLTFLAHLAPFLINFITTYIAACPPLVS